MAVTVVCNKKEQNLKMIKKLILAILVIIICGEINAQIITDRPDQTESSSTIAKGSLQIESGVFMGNEGNESISTRQILLPTNLFRYGITNGIELRILNQFEGLKVENNSFRGVSDLEVGAKIQMLKKESLNTEIVFLTHLIIPSGTNELTSGKYGSINKICISHELNENTEIGYNLGYNYFGEGAGDLTYSLAIGIGVNEKVGIYIEPYGEVTNLEEFILNFDSGVTYLVNQNLQLDFSFGTGINHRMNYISTGCSWLINKD